MISGKNDMTVTVIVSADAKTQTHIQAAGQSRLRPVEYLELAISALQAEVVGYRKCPHHTPGPSDTGLRAALRWYGEQARLSRLIHSQGDAGRHALAADGGKRANDALAQAELLTPRDADYQNHMDRCSGMDCHWDRQVECPKFDPNPLTRTNLVDGGHD